MPTKAVKFFCPQCKEEFYAEVKTPNHLLHFFLTILTFSFWFWVWLFLVIKSFNAKRNIRCPHCGSYKVLRVAAV